MSRKKTKLYTLSLLVFVIFSSISVGLLFRTSTKVYEERVKEIVAKAEVDIARNLAFHANDLQLIFSTIFSGGQETEEELFQALLQLEQRYALEGTLAQGGQPYLADSKGIVYNGSKEDQKMRIGAPILVAAQSNTFAVTDVYAREAEDTRIAMILPLRGEQYFLVYVYEKEQFLEIARKEVQIPGDYGVLLDQWKNEVVVFTEDSLAADQEKLTKIKENMAASISAYTFDPIKGKVQNFGFFRDYNAFLAMDTPTGWAIGVHMGEVSEYPLFSSITNMAVLVFIAILILGALIIVLDVVSDRESEQRLMAMRNIDQLTGLCSNAGMESLVETYMAEHSLKGQCFVCMDIVAFSRLNNMFGYSQGDLFLKCIGTVIQKEYACGVRNTADKFAFITNYTPEIFNILTDKFNAAIGAEIGAEYIQLISFKFGIYPFDEARHSFREVYDGALLALKDAKKTFNRHQVVFNEELRQDFDMRKNIETNMVHALSKEEFLVYVQPQFDGTTHKCCKAEALIRWQSEYMGFLPPDKFVPLFEMNGFIIETDFFMLTRSLDVLQERYDQGLPLLPLAVNQSKTTITFPNYLERLKYLVKNYTIPLRYIELEVTESTLENNLEAIVPLIHGLKKIGFSIAMDDFGSGFSSLNTLRLLPLDVLKIDKGFLDESGNSQRSKAIIGNVINMAKDLDIRVVCEGVETKDQIDFLGSMHCDVLQGYYFSKPIPIHAFVTQYMDKPEQTHSAPCKITN